MESTSASSSSMQQGVRLPSYILASGPLLRAMERVSSIRAGSTTERGEEFSVSMACTNTVATVLTEAVMILPLTEPAENQALDFDSFLSSFVFIPCFIFMYLNYSSY